MAHRESSASFLFATGGRSGGADRPDCLWEYKRDDVDHQSADGHHHGGASGNVDHHHDLHHHYHHRPDNHGVDHHHDCSYNDHHASRRNGGAGEDVRAPHHRSPDLHPTNGLSLLYGALLNCALPATAAI